jgi:hypothetical protein
MREENQRAYTSYPELPIHEGGEPMGVHMIATVTYT